MFLRELHQVNITIPDSGKTSIEYLLQNINKLIFQEKKDSKLFSKICREIINIDNYQFVWIGLINKNETDKAAEIEPIAYSGSNDYKRDFLDCLVKDINSNNMLFLSSVGTKKFIVTRNKKLKIIKTDIAKEQMMKNDFSSSILIPLRHNDCIIGLINIFSNKENSFGKHENNILLKVALIFSKDIQELKLETQLKTALEQLQRALYETIDAITLMSEIKDPYTSGHQKKVAIIASTIAAELGLPKDAIDGIYIAGLLHDVGKISIPNDILAKPGKLNEGEFIIIKNHPVIGQHILENIEFPWPIADIVNQHHERIDGSGYPNGITGEKMSVGARILAVADVVEAMTAHRPYRPALGLKKAISEIEKNKGLLYDNEIVEACIKIFKEKKISLNNHTSLWSMPWNVK